MAAATEAPGNNSVLPPRTIPAEGVVVPFSAFKPASPFRGQAVRVFSSEGSFNMQLFPGEAPATVRNFLRYVDAGAYRNMVVHRSDPGFVIQTGALTLEGSTLQSVPTKAPVTNEFRLSNTRGTAAMAKVDGNPNSATSQWFVNLANNSGLDTNNGGFTVFARVLPGGMQVIDRIARLPVYNKMELSFDLMEVPLKNYNPSNTVNPSNLVLIDQVQRIPAAVSSDPAAFTAERESGGVRIKFRGFPSNSVSLKVHTLDRGTNARIVSLPLKPSEQSFWGLLQRSNGAKPTLVSMAVKPTGAFEGRLENKSGTTKIDSASMQQKFAFTNVDSGVLLDRVLGESAALWYDHQNAAFVALNFASGNFSNTLGGVLLPAAYSGNRGGRSPLAGRIVNAILTRTNEPTRPTYGFLQFSFDQAGANAGAARITAVLPGNRDASSASRIVTQPWSGQKLLPLALFAGNKRSACLSGTVDLAIPPGTNAPLAGVLNWNAGSGRAISFDIVSAAWPKRLQKNVLTGRRDTVECRLVVDGAPPQTLVWSSDNKPRVKNPGGVTFEFDPKSGSFKGTVPYMTKSGAKGALPFRGIMFPTTPAGMPSGLRGCGIQTTRSGTATVKVLYP